MSNKRKHVPDASQEEQTDSGVATVGSGSGSIIPPIPEINPTLGEAAGEVIDDPKVKVALKASPPAAFVTIEDEEDARPEIVPGSAFDQEKFEAKCHVTNVVKALPISTEPPYYKLVSDTKVVLDRKRAEQELSMDTFIGERGCEGRWVGELVAADKGGDFIAELVMLIHVICVGLRRTVRINGQHVCAHVLYMPSDYRIEVRNIVYEVQTEDEMRRLYAAIDCGRPRSNRHKAHALLFGRMELGGLGADIINAIHRGYRHLIATKGQKRVLTVKEVCNIMIQDGAKYACAHVGQFLTEKRVLSNDTASPSKGLRKPPIYAAMISTCNAALATNSLLAWIGFWTEVMCAGEPTAGRPAFMLRQYLSFNHNTRGGLTLEERQYRASVIAWNHFRSDKPLNELRIADVIKRPQPL